MKRDADTGVSVDGADVWHERLGWAFGLTASDPAERAAALVRLADAERNTQDALDRYNRAWRRGYPLGRQAARRNYLKALRCSLPGGLWDRPAGPGISTWPGLPYVLCFLEWEARYPQEWTRCAKSWGTKEGLIRDVAAAHHDETVRSKLVELVETVVQRPYRCKDREYVRVARAVDSEDLRSRLGRAARSDNPWAQRHAGYVLWLLDRPEVPNTRHVWRTWLATASREQAPTGVTRGRSDAQSRRG
ncbi:hypothetical protein [Streptomyces sp. CB02400]|uniref:hypothetical protein n=1 Tax=Streptomyces sp. CB02400 TaxID=1703944 RepID=UPI001F3DA245|nr:hypothetical protein [Streptomyces sp. CB02400]